MNTKERAEALGFILAACPRCNGSGQRVSGMSSMADCRCCQGAGSLWISLDTAEQQQRIIGNLRETLDGTTRQLHEAQAQSPPAVKHGPQSR